MKCESVCLVALLFLCTTLIWAYDSRKCDDWPSQTGPCKASFQMWRFIKERMVCEPFIYGGCQGTKNMFDQEADCEKACLQ
nr:isoinhibitor K-like [Drosophila bipectinata]